MPILTPSGRGMGHLDGPFELPSTKRLFGARRGLGALMGNVDLRPFVDQIRNQGKTSRCVGAAASRILHIAAQRQRGGPDFTVPYPSERGQYSLAREEACVTGDEPLVDEGSYPGMLAQAVTRDVGIVLERDFPEDDDRINERVPAEVLAKSLSLKVQAAHAIDSDGTMRVDDAVQTLLDGFGFICGIPVGDQYENCDSETPVGPAQGTIYGRHCIAIVGVKTVAGRRLFLNAGSWGTDFGFGGFVWLDESVILDPRASDFTVFTVVPDFK